MSGQLSENPQNKLIEKDNGLVAREEDGGWRAKTGKGSQMDGDGWKLDFGGERAILYIDVKLCYTPETYIML